HEPPRRAYTGGGGAGPFARRVVGQPALLAGAAGQDVRLEQPALVALLRVLFLLALSVAPAAVPAPGRGLDVRRTGRAGSALARPGSPIRQLALEDFHLFRGLVGR